MEFILTCVGDCQHCHVETGGYFLQGSSSHNVKGDSVSICSKDEENRSDENFYETCNFSVLIRSDLSIVVETSFNSMQYKRDFMSLLQHVTNSFPVTSFQLNAIPFILKFTEAQKLDLVDLCKINLNLRKIFFFE